MHEISIALSIVEIATEEALRHGADKVEAVHLRIGPMAAVAREALIFAYGFASEGGIVEGSRLVIEEGQGMQLEVVGLEIMDGQRRNSEAATPAG